MAITFSNWTITVASRRAPCLQSSQHHFLPTRQCNLVLKLSHLLLACTPDAIRTPLLTLKALQNLAQMEYFISHVSYHLYSFPDPIPCTYVKEINMIMASKDHMAGWPGLL